MNPKTENNYMFIKKLTNFVSKSANLKKKQDHENKEILLNFQ